MLGKVGLPNDQIANEGGSFFTACGILTNADFPMAVLMKERG